MKVTLNWLKEYVDINVAPHVLADKLLNAGFEVEEIKDLSAAITNVKLGRIIAIDKHGNADKLQVCTLDMGGRKRKTIITAATNVSAGDLVPVALDGAHLPCGKDITAGAIRGVLSEGMLCGGSELGLDDTMYPGAGVDGILIMRDDGFPLGSDINRVLGYDDIVFDISVTSNRPDCQSVYGIAREISVILGKPLRPLDLKFSPKEGGAGVVIKVETRLCPRYMAKAVMDIRQAPAPLYMQHRLRAVGIRPINNIVDVTNYVLWETGQPMHAFDVDRLSGKQLNIRLAEGGEKITALDGKTYSLQKDMLVIADGAAPVAIAGVMGGEQSGVTAATASILLESARFARGSVRATGRKLGLRSDSSARFEKGVDQNSPEVGLYRAAHLIQKHEMGTVMSCTTDIGGPEKDRRVIAGKKKIAALLGISIPAKTAINILTRLSIKARAEGDKYICEVPAFRSDIEDYADIAEELIRIYGYQKIKSEFIVKARPTVGSVPAQAVFSEKLKNTMAGQGAYEITTYSFGPPDMFDRLNLNKDDIWRKAYKIRNPLGEDYSVMRTTLLHNMLSAAEFNLKRKNNSIRLFELGRVYSPSPKEVNMGITYNPGPQEGNRISALVSGQGESFYTLKGLVENIALDFNLSFDLKPSSRAFLHPGKSAELSVGGRAAGYMGEVHPLVMKNYGLTQPVYAAEIDFDLLLELYAPRIKAAPPPQHPDIERDIAVVVPENVTAGEMSAALLKSDPLITGAKLFDVYRGDKIPEGFKSAAFKLKIQPFDRTLTDKEVILVMEKAVSALSKAFGAKLRS